MRIGRNGKPAGRSDGLYRRRFTNVLLQSAKRLLTRATSLEIAMVAGAGFIRRDAW
jgi:hypothetical protein